MNTKDKTWLQKGLAFQCQGSGKCCISRGEYGFVYLTDDDRKNMAKALSMSLTEFTQKHCDQSDGTYHLKEIQNQPECRFLKNSKCSVYEGRPTQCRTWPFWPENLNAKDWKRDVVNFCPGAGKGPTHSYSEIRKIAAEQAYSEEELFDEILDHWTKF